MSKEEIPKRKKKLKFHTKLILIIVIIVLYSFFLGTKGIFIKEFKIESKQISKQMHGLKILHFSDLHFSSSVNKNDVKKIVKKINQAKPDIVIFTGDLINKNHKLTREEKEFITKEFKSIKSELGKYYVTGEEDFDEANSIFNLSGFINIEDNFQIIHSSNNSSLLLINNKNADKYFSEEKITSNFNILVTHNPNDFDKIKKYNFDMVLSGHTHNGQINIPKIKDLFIDGKHKKTYEKIGKTKLFVNPGIGTSKVNARLFNHPTMFLYRLNKTSN